MSHQFKYQSERFIQLLTSGAGLTQKEIKEKLGLKSDRHVRRLINALREQGVPICEMRDGRRKRYYLDSLNWSVPGREVHLSESEILALVVAAQAAQAMLHPTPFRQPLRTAFETLLKQWAPHDLTSFELEEEPTHWHFSLAPSVDLDPAIFEKLREALTNRQTVSIDYFTASKNRLTRNRHIDPLMFATPANSWIVAAYCHRDRTIKDFALAGIRRIKLLEDVYFDLPEAFDPDLYFRDRFKALAGGDVEVVRLLVEPGRAEYFRRKLYHPTQQIETEREDGRIIISYEVAGLEEMRSFVQSWGVGITVLEPPALVERIKAEAEAVSRRYETMK